MGKGDGNRIDFRRVQIVQMLELDGHGIYRL